LLNFQRLSFDIDCFVLFTQFSSIAFSSNICSRLGDFFRDFKWKHFQYGQYGTALAYLCLVITHQHSFCLNPILLFEIFVLPKVRPLRTHFFQTVFVCEEVVMFFKRLVFEYVSISRSFPRRKTAGLKCVQLTVRRRKRQIQRYFFITPGSVKGLGDRLENHHLL